MRINEYTLAVLAECRLEGNTLFLPAQLERKAYEAVNKCLADIGGKWNRKAKGHVFDYDPAEAFENLLLTGETEDMKKTFQFFPTPRPLAELACGMAELEAHHSALEPSCGKGDLADVIYERVGDVTCVEVNADMERYLAEKPYGYTIADFLALMPGEVGEFDRIVMNPPFSKQQDIDHICHAYSLLKPGGVLVSILSPSPFYRTNKKSVDFREWLDTLGAEVVDIDAGAFKESGTMIATKIIKINKPCRLEGQ